MMDKERRRELLARGMPDVKWEGEPMMSGWYTEEEVDAVVGALRASMDWTVGFGSWCEEIIEFERRFAAYCGTEYAVSITSCGAGLDMSMMALDLQPGDEVICPAINFWAGHYSVIGYGGKLVLCEVDPATLCADPADVEKRITPRTRAILVTHMNGLSADMDAEAYLKKAVGGDLECEVIDASPWERRDYVAREYVRGRVFIAGDAAHQNSPTGGLGMHTGIIEAGNLAWKLQAVLDGWGGPDLLASYPTECRPVATRNVKLSTGSFSQITSLPGAATAAARLVDGGRRLAGLIINEQTRTQYCYDDSPICVFDGTPPPPDTGRFVPSARPGTRAPHAWIDGDTSTLDLFGAGFVLLRLGDAPPDATALARAAEAAGMPLEIVDIRDGEIASLYERKLVLVRPDGHVAWRDDAPPADAGALMARVCGHLGQAGESRS